MAKETKLGDQISCRFSERVPNGLRRHAARGSRGRRATLTLPWPSCERRLSLA